MRNTTTDRIESIPWAAALLTDPKWTRTRTASREIKASGEDSLFAETIATDRTLRAILTLRPTEEADDKLAYHEILTMVDIGTGLNGFPDVLHGGIAATLLDEVCGILTMVNKERMLEKWKSSGSVGQLPAVNVMTGCRFACDAAYIRQADHAIDLNITYKRPIPTPGIILCTAKVERQDGRKLFVRATIEDGAGAVYTIGDALFIEVKPKL